MKNPILLFLAACGVSAALLVVLGTRVAGVPPLGTLLDPADGLYRTARLAEHPPEEDLALTGLQGPVTVLRDDRGVPHIFAASDRDAVMALGYVVAQDRLFQIDFISRAASGRLSEVMGPSALEVDRFMRRIGMEWGARKNVERILQEDGLEHDILSWYAEGVNAYIDQVDERDLPFEFRLLGYRPERYTPLHAARLIQYMTYDLSYETDDAAYARLRERLDEADFDLLYPRFSRHFVPIVPEPGGGVPASEGRPVYPPPPAPEGAVAALSAHAARRAGMQGGMAEGFIEGKGSNNWAVSGARSTTGAPILAGDMHLALSLPALWYEVHLVTPTMNTYGVTIPGAPLPIEAYNEQVGWAFTNTGADQIDFYALALDSTQTRYWYKGRWCDLARVPDTLHVRGAAPVVDTLLYAHWGPVLMDAEGAVATRWVGHEPSRLLRALWGMNHARGYDDFQEALRYWDAPMQNVLYADVHGNIAIRSAGYLPLRRAGHGIGLLDGATGDFDWVGRVPFDELPHSFNPPRGYLASTNQQPADSTYPHYLGHDWRSAYRSLRIDRLLRSREKHSVEDLRQYQADVHAVQRDLFVPLLDTLGGLSTPAEQLRQLLLAWDGSTDVDRPEPLVMDEFLERLERLAWDEPAFAGLKRPGQMQLLHLLRTQPRSKWLDRRATHAREEAGTLLRQALEATADLLAQRYGWGEANWRWGDHHKIVFRHVTRSEALHPLWRGPLDYPGFNETLSPARDRTTTHSASWRVVVDFSQSPPQGYGIYPGGAQGNPFSAFYDRQVLDYVAFEHYRLLNPASPGDLEEAQVSSRLTLLPE